MRALPPIVGGKGISVRSCTDAVDAAAGCDTASRASGAGSSGFRISVDATTPGPNVDWSEIAFALTGAGNIDDSRLAPLRVGGGSCGGGSGADGIVSPSG